MLVEYKESEGEPYSPGLGPVTGYGTSIYFKLTVLDSKSSATLLNLSTRSDTPYFVKQGDLHNAALSGFKNSEVYVYSAYFVGTALGMKSSAKKLLPAALRQAEVIRLLERINFHPDDAREEAFIAIARRDYEKFTTFDKSAVEPLLMVFEKLDWGTNNERLFANVAKALGAIGDPKAVEPLVNVLWDQYPRTEVGFLEMPLSIIAALEKLGGASARAELEEFGKKTFPDPKITEAARSASERLRKRLLGK